MSLLVVGECAGIERRPRRNPNNGETWEDVVIGVQKPGGRLGVTEVTAVRDFRGDLPERGDLVAIEAGVRAFKTQGGVGYALTAFGRNTSIEDALKAAPALAGI